MKLYLLSSNPTEDHILAGNDGWSCEVIVYHTPPTIQMVQLDRDKGVLTSEELRKIIEASKSMRKLLVEFELTPKLPE